jgi:hypothetical protein
MKFKTTQEAKDCARRMEGLIATDERELRKELLDWADNMEDNVDLDFLKCYFNVNDEIYEIIGMFSYNGLAICTYTRSNHPRTCCSEITDELYRKMDDALGYFYAPEELKRSRCTNDYRGDHRLGDPRLMEEDIAEPVPVEVNQNWGAEPAPAPEPEVAPGHMFGRIPGEIHYLDMNGRLVLPNGGRYYDMNGREIPGPLAPARPYAGDAEPNDEAPTRVIGRIKLNQSLGVRLLALFGLSLIRNKNV